MVWTERKINIQNKPIDFSSQSIAFQGEDDDLYYSGEIFF